MGQAFAGDGLEGIADPSITKEQLAELLEATTGVATITTVYYVWDPKEDITAYELALCLPYIVNHNMPDGQLPPKAARHFREVRQ